MKLSHSALLLAVAIGLAACQPESPPTTVASSVPEVLAPASSEDLQLLLSYSMRRALIQGLQNGQLTIQVDSDASGKGMVSGLPNPLKSNLRSNGKTWAFIKRSPAVGQGIAIYGASLQSEVYVGYLGEVSAVASLTSADLEAEDFAGDIAEVKSIPVGAGWQHSEPVRGTLTRASGTVSYALYRSPNNGTRDCVIFLQNTPKLLLRGDVCAPKDQKLGKLRAEAIIRGIGVDSVVPIEATPDLSTLPVD